MKHSILFVLLFITLFNRAIGNDGFLGAIDVLNQYPAVGSNEEKQDIDQMLSIQKKRTQKQCDLANLEKDSSLEAFYGGSKGLLSPLEIESFKKKLRSITVKTGIQIYLAKRKFNRVRPYITHKEIKPCIELESTSSYPSGHTTLARVYARILASALPERSTKFMKRADEIAYNRVLGGVHHPSDIEAGKKIGDAIADDYLSTSDNLYKLQYE